MDYSKDPTLLRAIIMEHYDTPSQKISNDDPKAHLPHYQNKSATCIDDITAYMDVENNVIKAIYFSGLGCAVSTASTDIMANYLIGKNVEEAFKIINNYINMTLGKEYDESLLGELIAFYNINKQANRIKCSQIGVLAIQKCLEEILGYGNH